MIPNKHSKHESKYHYSTLNDTYGVLVMKYVRYSCFTTLRMEEKTEAWRKPVARSEMYAFRHINNRFIHLFISRGWFVYSSIRDSEHITPELSYGQFSISSCCGGHFGLMWTSRDVGDCPITVCQLSVITLQNCLAISEMVP